MKYLLLSLSTLAFSTSFSQNRQPQIEVTFSPGLFAEQLSSDSLIPSTKQGNTRLGSISSFIIQVATPLKDERWMVKAGAGFSTRHYSLSKYGFNDYVIAILSLGLASQKDTFNIAHVKFKNNYIQVPVSFSYSLTKLLERFRLSAGLNIRPEFLTSTNAKLLFDSAYKVPTQTDISSAQKAYTTNVSKFIITVEPFIETSFLISKNWGGLIQFRPFSIYSSDLDKRLTTATTEFLGFTFGAYFKL